MGLKYFIVVGNRHDYPLHVVSLGGLIGNDGIQFRTFPVRAVCAWSYRQRAVTIVGEIGEKILYLPYAILIVFRGEMTDAAFCGMGHSASKVIVGYILADDGLDDGRTGGIHIAATPHHEIRIRKGSSISGASWGGPHYGRKLRY